MVVIRCSHVGHHVRAQSSRPGAGAGKRGQGVVGHVCTVSHEPLTLGLASGHPGHLTRLPRSLPYRRPTVAPNYRGPLRVYSNINVLCWGAGLPLAPTLRCTRSGGHHYSIAAAGTVGQAAGAGPKPRWRAAGQCRHDRRSAEAAAAAAAGTEEASLAQRRRQRLRWLHAAAFHPRRLLPYPRRAKPLAAHRRRPPPPPPPPPPICGSRPCPPPCPPPPPPPPPCPPPS